MNESFVFKLVLTSLLTLSTGISLGTIDQPRKPLTPGSVAMIAITNTLIIFGLWKWA